MTSIDLRQYIDILRRYSLVIALVAMLTVTVVLLAGTQISPIYQAQTTIRVSQEVGVQDFRVGVEYSDRLMNTYQNILTSWTTLSDAARRLGKNIPPDELSKAVTVEVVPKSELMTIAFEDKDPEFARDYTNLLAALLIEYNQATNTDAGPGATEILEERLRTLQDALALDQAELGRLLTERGAESDVAALQSRIAINETSYAQLLQRLEEARVSASLQAQSITIIEFASIPTTPNNVISLRHVAISIIAGIFGGIGLALVFENMDTRIRTPKHLENITSLPILGVIPRGLLPAVMQHKSPKGLKRTFLSRNGHSRNDKLEEAYKLLNINLQQLRERYQLNTILITSIRSQDDKANVAVNLAYMTAKDKNTVFLIEGDLRNPTLGNALSLESEIGLTNFLVELSPMSDMIQPTSEPTLFVTRSGPTPPNPTMLLDSPLMGDVLQYLGSQAQMTLIDTAPVLGTADVAIIAPKVDGVLLVVKEEAVSQDHVSEALKQLEAIDARVLGIIFLSKSNKV